MSKKISFITSVQKEALMCSYEEKEQILLGLWHKVEPYVQQDAKELVRTHILMELGHYVLVDGLSQEPTNYSNTI